MMVLIADASSVIRSRITKLISGLNTVEAVLQASTLENVIRLQDQFHPNVYIIAHDLPGGNIIETVTRIQQASGDAKLIVLSDIDHPKFAEKCLSAGATHIFDKSSEFDRILDVLK